MTDDRDRTLEEVEEEDMEVDVALLIDCFTKAGLALVKTGLAIRQSSIASEDRAATAWGDFGAAVAEYVRHA